MRHQKPIKINDRIIRLNILTNKLPKYFTEPNFFAHTNGEQQKKSYTNFNNGSDGRKEYNLTKKCDRKSNGWKQFNLHKRNLILFQFIVSSTYVHFDTFKQMNNSMAAEAVAEVIWTKQMRKKATSTTSITLKKHSNDKKMRKFNDKCKNR